MNRQSQSVLWAGAAMAISAVLASCGPASNGAPAAQFGVPVVTVIGVSFNRGSLAFGDVDRDGKLDIVLPAEGRILLLRGNGDGTFKPAEAIEGLGGAARVTVGDLNRDGNLDLAVAGCLTAPCAAGAGSLFIMDGNGDGTFGAPVALPTQYPVDLARGPLIADFNVDGWPDVAAVWLHPTPPIFSEWKQLAIFLGTATGMMPAAGLTVELGPLKPGHVADVDATDVNLDGKPDLIVYASSIEGAAGWGIVKLGRGDGTFFGAGGVNAHCVLGSRYALADFNRDGKLDLVIGMGDLCEAPMNLYRGSGDGNFAPAESIDVPPPEGVRTSWTRVLADDLDGDGIPDVLVRWTDTSALSILYGNGDGTFRAADDYAVGVPGSVEGLRDLNGDGRPDLVLVSASGIVTMLNTR